MPEGAGMPRPGAPAPGVPRLSAPGICPNCGQSDFRSVRFTWWGGALGPALLSHVKCNRCGAAFNSKTGQSNRQGIAVYTVVLGLISLALLIVLIVLWAK